MALINNLYVFVEDEDVSRDIESTTHPVETGLEIESTIRRKPIELSIKGKIVDVNGMKASEILAQLCKLQKDGSLIDYKGRNLLSNVQIQSISTSHPNTNAGGADFDMTLKQVRIVKSSYKASKNSNKQKSKKNSPNLSVGSIVVFKGGSVYVSSDAKKAAANRGRSTCKITIINKRSWAIHPYHLISTDGKMVYGWVDKSNIEGVTSSKTNANTNGGTQQVKKGSDEKVYHLVRKGDTVYDLVNTKYKEYNLSCSRLIKDNPRAFSVIGNAKTLQTGAKLRIY